MFIQISQHYATYKRALVLYINHMKKSFQTQDVILAYMWSHPQPCILFPAAPHEDIFCTQALDKKYLGTLKYPELHIFLCS